MKHSQFPLTVVPARSVFPDLAPANERKTEWMGERVKARSPSLPSPVPIVPAQRPIARQAPVPKAPLLGQAKAVALSFQNMNRHGDLLINFLKARKETFIDRLGWDLPECDDMEFDQYDTPFSKWIIIHEHGEILAGLRLTPTIAKCGIYSYMLRDAQKGLLDSIPDDVLFFDAPVDSKIWEGSRIFVTDSVPAHKRIGVQIALMQKMTETAREAGAMHVIGIVPAAWSRWIRRLGLDAVPVGPKFDINGTFSQAALMNVSPQEN